jgi:hypothetical protein
VTITSDHLNLEAAHFIGKSLHEKVEWVRKDHFVYYPKARDCLDQLNWILEQASSSQEEDFPSDLEGMSIIGESGAGKTAIVHELIRQHSCKHHISHEEFPVAYCMLKDSCTGLKGLYTALFAAYGHPYADPESLKVERVTVDQLEEVLIHTLKKVKTRLLFIDEFQHAKGKNQQPLLNQLKRTMIISRVPFVPVGTPEVEMVLNLDAQLADRCPVKEFSTLHYWSFDEGFRKFLAGYEQFLPFPEPSGLGDKSTALAIFEKVQLSGGPNGGMTNLRHVVRFLKKVATRALFNKHDAILDADIHTTSY